MREEFKVSLKEQSKPCFLSSIGIKVRMSLIVELFISEKVAVVSSSHKSAVKCLLFFISSRFEEINDT